jgi:hypothetical protein
VFDSVALVLARASNGAPAIARCNGADPTIEEATGARSSEAGEANRCTFDVTVLRAPGADAGTTLVGLRFTTIKPSGTSSEDCAVNRQITRLVF